MRKYKIGIVGSGPAGLTAAIYAARSEYSVAVFGGYQPLGQLMNTTDVENYPGYTSITGPALMTEMKKQATECGAEFIQEEVTHIEIEDGFFKIKTNDSVYFVESCIVATGSTPKLLGLESEQKFWGHGISTCATCDGPLFKDKVVCVIGGGNTAAEEALFLSGITSKVYLIHRRDTMRADNILQKRLFERENIEFLWDCEAQEFLGESSLTHVMIYNKVEDRLFKIAADAAFIAIGHTPQTAILKDLCPIENGYVKASAPHTNIWGLFVAGDIADHVYRQAATAVGDGCKAGMESIKFLQLGRGIGHKNVDRSEPRSERRNYTDRPDRPFEDRPRSRPDDGQRSRSFGDRPDRGDRPFGDRPPRPFGDRPSRPFGDRPPRPFGDRPSRPFGDRPPRPFGDRPSRPFGDRPPRPFGDRPSRPFGDRRDGGPDGAVNPSTGENRDSRSDTGTERPAFEGSFQGSERRRFSDGGRPPFRGDSGGRGGFGRGGPGGRPSFQRPGGSRFGKPRFAGAGRSFKKP